MNLPVTDYIESGKCCECEKDDKECFVVKLEAYEGPHCPKCLFRAIKKRKLLTKPGMPTAQHS